MPRLSNRSSSSDTLPSEILREASNGLAVVVGIYWAVYFMAAFLVPPPPELAEHARSPLIQYSVAALARRRGAQRPNRLFATHGVPTRGY